MNFTTLLTQIFTITKVIAITTTTTTTPEVSNQFDYKTNTICSEKEW